MESEQPITTPLDSDIANSGLDAQEALTLGLNANKRRKRYAASSRNNGLSPMCTFLFALLAVGLLFTTKRYSLEEMLRSVGLYDDTMFSMGESIGVPNPEGVKKEYAICTRHRKGVYTVNEAIEPGEDSVTQCMVVDEQGIIANVGSIGKYLLFYCMSSPIYIPLDTIKVSHPHIKPRFLPKKAIVVPGLVDSHVHFLEYGWSRTLNLDGLKNVQEVVRAVREYVLERDLQRASDQALQRPLGNTKDGRLDEEEWIEGVGWDQNKWENWKGGFPTHVSLRDQSSPLPF
jgi:hypothetical protein